MRVIIVFHSLQRVIFCGWGQKKRKRHLGAAGRIVKCQHTAQTNRGKVKRMGPTMVKEKAKRGGRAGATGLFSVKVIQSLNK